MGEEGRSLAITPTRAFVTMVTLMWLNRTKRKSLLAALEKIKEGEISEIWAFSESKPSFGNLK
uniref:Uncharacterized protein n=1 Tax=Cucumis melo TaxID=3656 RepID=A0A9I9ECW0_CUCME